MRGNLRLGLLRQTPPPPEKAALEFVLLAALSLSLLAAAAQVQVSLDVRRPSQPSLPSILQRARWTPSVRMHFDKQSSARLLDLLLCRISKGNLHG